MTDTESNVTADLVRELLREQHSDLAGPTIREVAGGAVLRARFAAAEKVRLTVPLKSDSPDSAFVDRTAARSDVPG